MLFDYWLWFDDLYNNFVYDGCIINVDVDCLKSYEYFLNFVELNVDECEMF